MEGDMITIEQLQAALARAEEHKRLGRLVQSFYPAGRTTGSVSVGVGNVAIVLHEDTDREAFAAVFAAIKKRMAAIETELAAMGVGLGAA
jgi:hypothetical protein